MSQEDAELLRLVREWRPSATLHPIAMQAWDIYEDGGVTLSDESLEKIKGAVDGYAGELKSLGEALEGLARFSILLSDHQADPIGAEKVVSLMRQYTPLFEPLWERVVEALASAGPSAQAAETRSSATNPAAKRAHPEPHG